METTKKIGKDGKTYTRYKLQVGDRVISQFARPRKLEKGKYINYSLGVMQENDKLKMIFYLAITKAQNDKCLELGDLTGKTLEAYEYENKYGKQVGIKIVK